ncbi:GntR family transcriptional regulator [Streptomyces longisporus]|uniref:HTH gntR-type domain-containing protein n=1 Tax=Streptomyces longisporus TaxID=1948 RepID=A0ABP5YLJ6_STRLO
METALREMLSSGTLKVNQSLPTQRQLAEEYGVSRDTVQRVLSKLTEEGWIASRQGSRMWVVRLPAVDRAEQRPAVQGRVSLRPLIDRAFEQAEVSLDVFSLTCETLLQHLRNQAERVLEGGIAPQRVRIRMLLPWEQEPLPYPRAKDPGDLRVWERWRDMVQLNLGELRRLGEGLHREGVDIRIEIRRIPAAPQFKLYVLNDSEMLIGPYEVVERKIPVKDGDRFVEVDSLDVLGFGSILSYHRLEDDEKSHDSIFFSGWKDWFGSIWDSGTVARLRSEEDPAESSVET